MRVVLETPPVPMSYRMPGGGLADGSAFFRAILYEPGENTNPAGPAGEPSGQLVSHWRSGLSPGQPLRVPPDGNYVGASAVMIPGAILDALPENSRLQLLWSWTRKADNR